MAKKNRATSARRLCVRKKYRAVVFEEGLRRLGELFGKTDCLALVSDEVLLERGLGQIAFQVFAEHKTKPFIQRDQAAVKRRVVKRGKAQTILRIETLFVSTDAPRFDVTRNQQVGNGNTGNATTDPVRIEDCLTKVLLAATHTYGRLGLRRTRGRRQPTARLKSNPVRLKEINFTLIVFREQVMKQLFAGWRKGGEIIVKLVPHNPVLLRRAFESFDAACFLHRVERREIAQLHREAVRRPSHFLSHGDDYGIEAVELSEWQLAVKIERDEQVLARPFYARSVGHGGRLPDLLPQMKPKSYSP